MRTEPENTINNTGKTMMDEIYNQPVIIDAVRVTIQNGDHNRPHYRCQSISWRDCSSANGCRKADRQKTKQQKERHEVTIDR
jgi:hypothetical protein